MIKLWVQRFCNDVKLDRHAVQRFVTEYGILAESK